jgi:hypothetical protein
MHPGRRDRHGVLPVARVRQRKPMRRTDDACHVVPRDAETRSTARIRLRLASEHPRMPATCTLDRSVGFAKAHLHERDVVVRNARSACVRAMAVTVTSGNRSPFRIESRKPVTEIPRCEIFSGLRDGIRESVFRACPAIAPTRLSH